MTFFFKCVESAFHRTKELLWPFQKAVWIKLLFLFLLTGGCSTGSFLNIPDFGARDRGEPRQSTREPQDLAPIQNVSYVQTTRVASEPSSAQKADAAMEKMRSLAQILWGENKTLLMTLVGILFLIALLLYLILTWVYSRLSVVLLRALQKKDVTIKRTWNETSALGESFFKFNVVSLAFLVVMGVSVAGGGLGFYKAFLDRSVPLIFLLVGSSVFILLMVVLVAVPFWFFIKFLPVVMCVRNLGALDSLRFMWGWAKKNLLQAILLLFLYVIFSVGISTVLVFIGVVLSFVVMLPLALLGGALAYFLKVFLIRVVLGIVGGVLFLVLAVVLMALLIVPMGTFLTYLRLELVEKRSLS